MRIPALLLLSCLCISAHATLRIVALRQPGSYYIPPVRRADECSGLALALDVPPNTLSVIYALSTHTPGVPLKDTAGLGLEAQVRQIAGPAVDSETFMEIGEKVHPADTAGSVICYVLQPGADNLERFRRNEHFDFVRSGSRANFRGGAVSVRLAGDGAGGTLHVAVRNPSASDSVLVTFEAVAIVRENEGTPLGSDTAAVLKTAQQMPVFPGSINAYLSANLKAPEVRSSGLLEGSVRVRFIVRENGWVDNVTVIKSSGNQYLDAEGVRVIRQMPRWNPGMNDGKPVPVYFTIPLTFEPEYPGSD